MKRYGLFFLILFILANLVYSQNLKNNNTLKSKSISPNLFGIFFEDLNYAADGGLYAELVQNRSFEYSPSDIDNWHDETNWHPFTAWQFMTKGFGYGTISLETRNPVHPDNPHYIQIHIEEAGANGVGIMNMGYNGMVIKSGEQYRFSVFINQISDKPIPLVVKLEDKSGETLAESNFATDSMVWKKYEVLLTANTRCDSAHLVLLAQAPGKLDIDMVSLFPQNTFKNRKNGLRKDLAETIAALQPKFMRFPGGCLVHGDGLENIYKWKNTIGPVEQRKEQRNIWQYRQSGGLGYFEYFQFCDDIGAIPIPVIPAAVSCQNSGGTWRTGSNGQKCLPMQDMESYIQDVLDLIEYANGPATSDWGAKRANAGHPAPFNLKYLGIGNEDKITPGFKERFEMIYNAIKKIHPEITVIGTVGPFSAGEDYENGWAFAKELKLAMVDEHYYNHPEWFLNNQNYYDKYDRMIKVYLGEYASKGNTLFNALSEAAYMTSLERNGDLVQFASYAPLLANIDNTQWNPDLIYFNNTTVCPTINYYVQQLFSKNSGNVYYDEIITTPESQNNNRIAYSCVGDTSTNEIILKLVNADSISRTFQLDITKFKNLSNIASQTILAGKAKDKNTFESSNTVIPQVSEITINRNKSIVTPAYSLYIIRIKSL